MENKKTTDLMINIFGVFVFAAVLGGVIVFVMYLLGFIIGGDAGQGLVLTAESWVPLFIKAAAIAMVAGLITFYSKGEHQLSLDSETDGSNARELELDLDIEED